MTPDAALVLAALTARGARLTMPGQGRLVVLPADAASPDDLAALASGKPWLLQAWRAAAAWDTEHPPRPDVDPLPDDADPADPDHARC